VIPSNNAWSVTDCGKQLRSAAGVLGVTYDPGRKATVVVVGSGQYSFRAS
jgi:alpha-L-rhamnosidase